MPGVETVEHVDVARYMGTWYEIAKFPVSFEKGLVDITATYSLLPDGSVQVINSGRAGGHDGKVRTAKGKAKVADPKTNAKLKVSFFWPFSADYWIIDLGRNYEYAVVSGPSMRYLWILSRTTKLDEPVYAGILNRLQERGFDISKLQVNE